MKKLLSLATAGIVIASSSFAGTITVANSDIELGGGLSAGYVYANNQGANANNDYFTVSSFAVDLHSKMENAPIEFTAFFGQSVQDDLIDLTAHNNASFDTEYAYVTIKPISNLYIDAGILTTNVGYELFHTYDNPNFIYGLVWYAQPFRYTGARATYSISDNLNVYAEYNHDDAGAIGGITPSDAYAIGVNGSVANIDFAVSYYDYAKTKNLVDVVVSTKIANISVALNADYQWLDDNAKKALPAGSDDNAYGVALYVIPEFGRFMIPVRLEYVNEGTSEIYGVAGDSAWSATITPTWSPTNHTYLRAELAYVSTDQKGFTDDKGKLKDNRTIVGVEAGFKF